MPLRSHGKRAALPAAARGSLDIREVFRGTAVAAPCVPTVDSGEPPSNHKRKRVPSPHAASAKQIDVREALLRGSQQHCQSSLTSYSLSLAQEEALATWGENSFHAACQAWNIMDDHASPLLLLANLQLIPPTVVTTFALSQDLDDSNSLPGIRRFLDVASAWYCLQSKLQAAIDADDTARPPR